MLSEIADELKCSMSDCGPTWGRVSSDEVWDKNVGARPGVQSPGVRFEENKENKYA